MITNYLFCTLTVTYPASYCDRSIYIPLLFIHQIILLAVLNTNTIDAVDLVCNIIMN